LNNILEQIHELSKTESKSLEQMALKLGEETGECFQALLSWLKANGCEYKQLTSQDIKEECIDVILVALSLFYKLDGNPTELIETLTKKMDKWKEKSNL
jgi:NTP pyrophosphatase (non-canonical NTP hydrolase)